MSFWGTEVKADGKPVPYVPPPEAARLHLSQATLGITATDGQKAAVSCKTQDGPEVFICNLKEGGQECCNLDLVFDHYTEFTVHGAASVHLAGYYMPEYEAEEEEDDEDEDGEDELAITGHPYAQHLRYGSNGDAYEFDSDDFDSEGSDDEDDENDDDEDGAQPRGRRSDVVIEELHEEAEPEETKDGALVKRQIGQLAPDAAAAAADGDKDTMTIEEGEAAARRAIEADAGAKDLPAAAKREAAELKGTPGSKRKGDKLQAAAAKKAATGEDMPQAAAGAQAGDEEAKAEEAKPLSRKQKKKAAVQAKTAAAQGPAEGTEMASAQPKAAQTAAVPVKAPEDDTDGDGEDGDDLEDVEDAQLSKAKKRTFPNGFEIVDLRAGQPDGKLAKPGKTVVVRYVGRLKNGKIFDQTKGQTTFKFRLGIGEVIKGWDRGVEGMRVGDKRRLTVPPQMGYGTSGVRGAIPPNSTLIFDVELVNVVK